MILSDNFENSTMARYLFLGDEKFKVTICPEELKSGIKLGKTEEGVVCRNCF